MTALLFISLHLRISRDILEGVYRGARDRRWNVQQFETIPPPDELRKIIDFWKPDGLLVYADRIGNPLPGDLVRRLPVVWLADRRPGRNTVNQDMAHTVGIALDELQQAGSRTFAYVGPATKEPWNCERRAEFLAQARRRGFKATAFAFDPDAADETPIQEFLLDLPTHSGVLIAADPYANRVIHAANHAGIRIPSDIAFVSVDNDELVCENLQPTLSSVRLDFRSAGLRMIELLDGLHRNGLKTPRKMTYGPLGVCRRESTTVVGEHPLVGKAVAFIRREAASPIGVSDVADYLGINRRTAQRLFAAHAKMTIAEAIRSARIERAKDALRKTDSPVELIACSCGFRSAAHLKTVFHRITGQTMLAYRRSRG